MFFFFKNIFKFYFTTHDFEQHFKLHYAASVSPSGPSPLFSRSSCLPTIHLVSGQTSCSSLPNTVDTKPLAELYTTGPGEIEVSLAAVTS